MNNRGEIIGLAAEMESVRGQRNALLRTRASYKMVEAYQTDPMEVRVLVVQLFLQGVISQTTKEWLDDRFEEEACRDDDDECAIS